MIYCHLSEKVCHLLRFVNNIARRLTGKFFRCYTTQVAWAGAQCVRGPRKAERHIRSILLKKGKEATGFYGKRRRCLPACQRACVNRAGSYARVPSFRRGRSTRPVNTGKRDGKKRNGLRNLQKPERRKE